MTSSASDLVEKIQEQFTNGEEYQQQSEMNQQFSAEQIFRQFNIKPDYPQEVEALLQYTVFGAKRWAFFDEEFFNQIPRRTWLIFLHQNCESLSRPDI